MFESKLKKSVKVADRINPCVVSSLICVQKGFIGFRARLLMESA